MKINPFLLERYFAKYEFTAPYLLCSSDCETLSIEQLLSLTDNKEEAIKNLLEVKLGYTESKGDPLLREKISKFYNKNVINSDNILTFAGAAEGIFLFMNAILNKGDNVITIFPAYQSLYEVAKSIGASVSLWKIEQKDKWFFDIDALKKMIKKNTRALIINFPHNPTGYMPSVEEYNQIIEICRDRKIYLFSDEVYRFIEYDVSINKNGDVKIVMREHLPSACELYENAISLGVMSKSFGLAGLRIGWISSMNKEILNKIAILKDYTTICSSAPSEFLAKVAIDYKDLILNRIRDIIFDNLKELIKFFNKWNGYFHFSVPQGGSIGFPWYYRNTDELAKNLIESKGVLLMPSSMFEFGKNHFRVGFGRKNMVEALNLFDQFCEENIK